MKTKRVDRPTDQRRPPHGPVCNSVDRPTDNKIRTSPPHGPVSPVFDLSVDRPTDTLKALPGAKAVSSSSRSRLQGHGGQNGATAKPFGLSAGSRFDGWLVRFIVMHGTPARLTIKEAAKHACIRSDAFAAALRNPALVRQDARHLGIDPDEMLAIHAWTMAYQAEADVAESMLQSVDSVTKKAPSSDKYRGSRTRLGATRPNPPDRSRDHLNLPVNPIQHPEPQGEWHAGLDAPGKR